MDRRFGIRQDCRRASQQEFTRRAQASASASASSISASVSGAPSLRAALALSRFDCSVSAALSESCSSFTRTAYPILHCRCLPLPMEFRPWNFAPGISRLEFRAWSSGNLMFNSLFGSSA